MPDFKELVKNLYATKGRELTEEKLSYIETNYGKGKEEEFVKNFYATIGEELPQEKFDYIRDTYLKKKEDGGIPYRTPSAPVAPSFGTPSVVEASEQLESQSKLTPPQKGGVEKLDLSKGVPVKPLSGDMPIGQLKVEKDLQRIQQSVPKVGRETMYRNAIKSNENKARLAEEKMLQIQPLLQEVDNIQQAGGEVPQELISQYNNALPTYNALLEQRNKSIDNIDYFNNALEGNRRLTASYTDSGFKSRFLNQGLDNLGSLVMNSIAGTSRLLKQALPPHLAVQAEIARNISQREGDKLKARAEYTTALMDEKDNYLNKEIDDIYKEQGLVGATEYALKKFTESLPVTLGIMTASATGTGGAVLANTALFGGSANQRYEELKDRTDMTEEQKIANAVGYGSAELLFEGVLSSGMGAVYKQMIKTMGKEAAEKAIKKNVIDLVTNGVKKYMPLSGAVVEGVGEGATQLTQNIIDKYTDPTKKDINVMEGVGNAAAIGFAGGGAMSAPTVLTYVNRSNNVEKNKEIEKKREAIQTELAKPISESTKEILQQTDNELMQEQNELVVEDMKDLTEKLPEEQKEEVKVLAEERRQIENALAETESEEVKTALENKTKQIGEQIDNIYDRAKEPIIGRTDVTQEGLGVATETGTQGVTREGVPSEEVRKTEYENKKEDGESMPIGLTSLRTEEQKREESAQLRIEEEKINNETQPVIYELERSPKLQGGNWDVLTDETKANIRNAEDSPTIDGHGILRVPQGETQLGVLLKILQSKKIIGDWGKLAGGRGNVMGAWTSAPFIITGMPNIPLANTETRELNPFSVILNSWGEAYYESLKKRFPNVNFIKGSELTNDKLLSAQPLKATEEKVSDALKDVESTAKALDKLPKDNITKSILDIPLQPLEIGGYKRKPSEQYELNDAKSISEAYHKAKADGSNPELVQAVETLLKPKEYATQEIKQPKGVRTEPEGGIKGGETKTPSVSDSVQRTKESEKEREVRGEKPPTPEIKAEEVVVKEGKGSWRNEFNKTKNIARKNQILETIAESKTSTEQELRDVYEAAKNTEKETNRINYALANNENTPQDIFDEIITSDKLKKTTGDSAIIELKNKRNGISKTQSEKSDTFAVQRKTSIDTEGADANARNEAKRAEVKSALTKLRDEGLLKTADKSLIGKAKKMLGVKSAAMSDAEIDAQMALMDAMAIVWKKTTGNDNFYETFIADIKKGDLAELKKMGGALFQDSENPKKPSSRITLAVFDAPQFEKMKGLQVTPQSISDLVKGRGKQIEKDIINMVLDYDKYKGQKRISFDEFRGDVETQIMKLEKIRTRSYADYGYDNLGDNENYGQTETVIFNSPIEHGEKGHFSGDFTTEGLDKIEWELRQIPNTDKWAAVDKNMPSNVTANNLSEYIGTAGEKIEVEKWIADRDKENNGGLNKGLFGHIRKWFNKRTGVFNIAELQSDYYQKNKASDLLKPEVSSEEVDAHMNKNVWLPMDREISEKIKKDWGITVKKTDDSFIAYDKDGKELSSIFFRETPSVGLNKGDFEENQVVVSALRKLSERRANDEKLEDGTYKVTITEFGEGVDEFYFKTYTEAENFIKINDGRFNGAQDDYNSIRSDYQEKRQKIRQIEEQKFIQNRQAELEKTKPVNIQLKQFVASQKVHELRLLREAIKMAADEGAETVRFPSQYTLAVIEGYVDATGEGRAPYEVVSGDYDRLYEGDIINYGGDDMIVVEQDRSTITVAPKDEVSVFNIYDLVEDETTYRVDEIEYEAKRYFVNIDAITREEVEVYEPSEWMGEYAKLLLEEYFQENESEETVRWKDISSDLYDKVRLSYDSMDVEDILSWSGKIWQDGDTIYAIEGRNYETFSQPDEYEPSSTEEDYYDNLSSEQRTVVDKYGELGKQFEKMRPDSRVVRDDNGMVWLETTITEEDKNNPIVAFQEEGGKVKGAIDFTNNNKATLYIFDGADISTLAHEMSGHLGRRVLERLAEANPDFAKQYEAVKKWAGVKDVWTTKAEEKFARAFERYLRNGVAPTKALKEVFSKLKEWLSNVYKVIKNSSIDINLTNDVRETFEALLGKEMFKPTAKERVEQVEPTEAEAVTPTKAERKEIASAKIDEIANALKDILPKIEGEKLGVGQDEIIDVIAKAVKALVNTGIEIDEAIKQVKARLSEAFDGVEGISDTDIKDRMKVTERLTPKSREEQNQKAQSYGFKNASHALNSVNKETGETYETFESIPDSVLEEVGKEKAKPETPKGKRRFTQQFIKQYPELAEMLSEDIVNYAKMPNNISVDMANAFIEEVGLEEARAAFADMSSGLPSGARMTLGQLVIKKLEEAGRVDEAIDVLEQVTTRATEMGQEIQALSMWAFLTPQGQLRYAQKTVNKAVERRKKQDKSKTDKLKEKLKKANQEAIDETLQDPKVRGFIEKTDSIIPKGLPTPETKKPKKYIVSDDRVAFLKKQIKGKLFSGIPTELIELSVAYVERGAYKFSDFSRAMIKEFGNKIKPYLKEVYTKATETLIKEDYDKSNFDSADNIDKQVAQQKADEAVEKVEKAIKAGNKKALAQAIANLQKVAKQNGLWGQYKKYAVSRLKQLTIQNISDDVKKNPPLDEFTKGLVQNIKSMMMEKAEPKEREKIAKRPAIEVIADAFKNPEAYKEVLEETQKEMRKKYKDDVESLEMLDEYFGEFFDKPFSSKLVGTAIKEAMKEMNITISDIVTSHYTVYDATKKSLVDKLVEQAGLSESEASVLAKAIEKEFDKIATEKKQKLLEKILSNKKRKTPEAKSLEQELIRLTNLGAFSDSDVMSKWAEKMGYPKLTQEQVKEIQKLADAVQRAGKGFERFRAIEDLLSYQANLKGVSQLDVAISIWYANILSGFTTQTINTVANLLNSAILYGNAVAQNPKNAKFIASGFIEGFKRGLIEAKETFRTGYSPIRGKVEVPPVLERVKFEGFSKPLEYAKFIGRLMKAADVLVFEALKEMRAYQLAAKQAAKTSALEPSQSIKDKAAEILGKSDYIIEEATETAELWYENKVEEINESNLSKEEKEKALKQAKIDKQRKLYEYLEEQRSPEFQSEVADYAASGTYNKKPDGILGWMASVINQAKDKLNIAAEDATNPFQQAAVNTAKVFANAIVPFTNIIANVANESLNYTPVGIARRISGTTALTYNKKELTDQQKVDLMTKAVIGNSLMVAIYLLATLPAGDDDEPLIEITANGTGDYRKNYELQADGWMPYSVRIGKKRISYQYTPFMIPLSFIGNIKDYEKYRGEKLTDMAFGNQAAVAFGHTFRTLLDMTALSSLNKFLSASLDPRNENKVEDLLKASEKTATSVVVPNLFTQSAKYIESAFQIPLKETSDQRFGNVLQHIPYVRNKYYDKLNALGEPIMPDTDKFLSTSKDEPIWGLIANKKAFIGKPSIKQMKRIDAETGQERFYTQEEYYNYGAIRGALIKEAIIKDFDKINAMSDKDAQEYIGSIKNEANMIARLAAESGKDEQSRSKIIETTKKSLEKDKAEKAKSEERKKKEEAKMSPQQIKYMNELDAISSKAGKIQYIINLKEKSGTTWYNVKKDIRKVISNDLIKDLKDLEKEGAIPKLGIAIKEKFD